MPDLAWDIGYRDQACWVMYERKPNGTILVLDTGEIDERDGDGGGMIQMHMPRFGKSEHIRAEAQRLADAGEHITLVSRNRFGDVTFEELKPERPMTSDFQVGDVVRFNEDQRQQVSPHLMGREWIIGEEPQPGDEMQRVKLAGVSGCYYSRRLSLVSRPSKGKPAFKVGDHVEVLQSVPQPEYRGKRGQVTDASDPHILGVDLGKLVYWIPATALKLVDAPEPGQLKVGDRVRCKALNWTGTIIAQNASGLHEWSLKIDGMQIGSTYGFHGHELELLEGEKPKPPTYPPGTLLTITDQSHPRYGQVGRVIGNQCGYSLEMKPGVTTHLVAGQVSDKPIEPSTQCNHDMLDAAAYALKHANTHQPRPMTATAASIAAHNAFEPLLPSADQMRFLGEKLMRDIANSMSLPREMLEGHAHRAPLPDDGWMPAGTYMPLGEEPPPKMKTPKKDLPYKCTMGETSMVISVDGKELGLGISRSLPAYTRRFPSRTNTYFNLGDEYELLEDGE